MMKTTSTINRLPSDNSITKTSNLRRKIIRAIIIKANKGTVTKEIEAEAATEELVVVVEVSIIMAGITHFKT